MADWTLDGNPGTNPPRNFLGTTDNKPLAIKTNGIEAMRITPGVILPQDANGGVRVGGNVGIGNTRPATKLHVRGGRIRLENQRKVLDLRADGAAVDVETTTSDLFLRSAGRRHNIVMNPDPGDGNVRIGAQGPDAKLHVSSGDGFDAPQVHIEQTTDNEFARLRFNSRTGGEFPGPLPLWDIAVGGSFNLMNFFRQNTGNVMTLTSSGRVGIGTEDPSASLHVEGDLFVNGSITKTGGGELVSQPDPRNPAREIVYATPIGDEVGTYVRGTGRLRNGRAVIELPEHFGLVTSEEGLSAQLTARGEWLQLYVAQLNTVQLVVQEAQGKSGRFDYLIQGVRRGYEKHQAIQERIEHGG